MCEMKQGFEALQWEVGFSAPLGTEGPFQGAMSRVKKGHLQGVSLMRVPSLSTTVILKSYIYLVADFISRKSVYTFIVL